MSTVAIHLYHDSTLSLDLGGELRNIELERVFGKRHYDVHRERPSLRDLVALVREECASLDTGIHIGPMDGVAEEFFRLLEVERVETVDHHVSHAAGAFYASPFEESLVISYDGGGNDGFFRFFLATRQGGLRPLADKTLNLGIPYRALASPIRQINKPDDGKERSNAGKLMGLAAYGNVRPDWTEEIIDFFHSCTPADLGGRKYLWMLGQLPGLGKRIGMDLSRNALEGSVARDLACTAQHVFEKLFLDCVLPIAREQRRPICVTGGCALNVIVNQRLADCLAVPIFVPPNPNDCGLAAGALMFRSRPQTPVSVTYSGCRITDLHILPDLAARYGAVETNLAELAQLLHDGCVIAVMRGQSEHGPRALGNRSILCNPQIVEMKARLNGRIKFMARQSLALARHFAGFCANLNDGASRSVDTARRRQTDARGRA